MSSLSVVSNMYPLNGYYGMVIARGPHSGHFLGKILGRYLILGKSLENIEQSTNLKLGNNNAIIIAINTFILCVMLHVIT